MPAQRLETTGAFVSRFDVIGKESSEDSAQRFVTHVGLAREDGHFGPYGVTVRVAHMRPPFQSSDEMCLNLAGSVSLTADEEKEIEDFLHIVDLECAGVSSRKQYIVHPHFEIRKRTDGTIQFRRFSCAGLVIEAYRWSEVDLVVTDPDLLPEVDPIRLLAVYPFVEDSRRSHFGLEGDGPWPIVLPGYVLQALNRPVEEIRASPYRPKPGDERFP